MELQAQANELLGKMDPKLAHLPVVIRAFANIDGLSGHLLRLGLIQSRNALWDFANTFSQAFAGSDFVFVGSGKDRADKKIKGKSDPDKQGSSLTGSLGVFEQFVRNPTCRHIVFGACHDNGYVRLLEDFTEDPTMVNRITLLHSFSVGREFQRLPFRSMEMDFIFQNSSPDASRISVLSNFQGVPATATSHSTIAQAWASLRTEEAKRDANTTHQGVLSQPVLVNAVDQRVDARLPIPSQAAIDSWNHKIKVAQMRYCRMHQLSGSCPGSCGYSHGPLSDDERLVFQLNLRRGFCRTGLTCRDWKCHYGHNCMCKKQSCKFPKEMHRVDDSTAVVFTEKQ